jgi:hypothetical protein
VEERCSRMGGSLSFIIIEYGLLISSILSMLFYTSNVGLGIRYGFLNIKFWVRYKVSRVIFQKVAH